ncbi:helix-turn-helix domain-containing protein [Salinibacterium sp. SWN248]|uniref:PucR family transcriptional regulator n=1 Tax=Salinibacterium sp. SWN248 TaxID=2792056 RepID=UPI0018CE6E64|nr:helix-turn-helix domain-containing protein [Salinibacterium sp. SWN248]MBH0022717.1 helix-turn-helix domain-containing protein [Salinibacterium sp. SWN248]
MTELSVPTILSRATSACLSEVDTLVERWTVQLGSIEVYKEGLVDLDRVIADCRMIFIRLLTDIGGHAVPPEAREVSERVGHTRALQGIPLVDVMSAIRLDYRVMWEAISAHTTDVEMREVFDSVPRIWDAIERHSQELTSAYTATQFGMAQVRQDERRLWFTRLLETDGKNHVLNTRACAVLSFAPESDFTIFTHADRVDESLDRLNDTLHRAGIVAHQHETESGPVLIAQMPREGSMPLNAITHEHKVLMLDGIPGISSVPAAIRVTQAVALVLPPSDARLVNVTDFWHVSVFQNPFDTGRIIHQRHVDALLKLPASERAVLERTADEFLTSGSIALASRALFCHRNTITNRLDSLERVTGLDLRLPAEASLYILARNASRAEATSHNGSSADAARARPTALR